VLGTAGRDETAVARMKVSQECVRAGDEQRRQGLVSSEGLRQEELVDQVKRL